MFSSVLIAVHGVTATSSSGSRNLNVCTQPVDRISEAQVVTAFIRGLIGFAWRLGRSMFLISFVSFVSLSSCPSWFSFSLVTCKPPRDGHIPLHRQAHAVPREAPCDRARCRRAHRYSVASSHLPQVG